MCINITKWTKLVTNNNCDKITQQIERLWRENLPITEMSNVKYICHRIWCINFRERFREIAKFFSSRMYSMTVIKGYNSTKASTCVSSCAMNRKLKDQEQIGNQEQQVPCMCRRRTFCGLCHMIKEKEIGTCCVKIRNNLTTLFSTKSKVAGSNRGI